MAIEYGFVTNRNVDLVTSLDTAGRLEFDFVEILMHGTSRRNILEQNIDAIRDQLNKNNLQCIVHLPYTGLDIGSTLESIREASIAELTKSLRVAGALGAEKAVLHPTSNADNADEQHQLMTQGVRTLTDSASKYGVEICAENLYGKYVNINRIDDIVDSTEASITFDTGHARIDGFSKADSATFLDEYRNRISHLHLNDTRGPIDEHLPIGAGTIDFEHILEPLRESSWSGTISLEVGTENLEYIAHSKNHLNSII